MLATYFTHVHVHRYMCQSDSPNSSPSLLSTVSTHPFCLHLYSCPANRLKSSPREWIKRHLWIHKGFPDSSVGKESTCNAGDHGSIPGSERSTGEGIGYPLQYSRLENSMDCIVHGVSESNKTEQLSFSLWIRIWGIQRCFLIISLEIIAICLPCLGRDLNFI